MVVHPVAVGLEGAEQTVAGAAKRWFRRSPSVHRGSPGAGPLTDECSPTATGWDLGACVRCERPVLHAHQAVRSILLRSQYSGLRYNIIAVELHPYDRVRRHVIDVRSRLFR